MCSQVDDPTQHDPTEAAPLRAPRLGRGGAVSVAAQAGRTAAPDGGFPPAGLGRQTYQVGRLDLDHESTWYQKGWQAAESAGSVRTALLTASIKALLAVRHAAVALDGRRCGCPVHEAAIRALEAVQ